MSKKYMVTGLRGIIRKTHTTDSFKTLIRVATDMRRAGYVRVETSTYNETTKQYERS